MCVCMCSYYKYSKYLCILSLMWNTKIWKKSYCLFQRISMFNLILVGNKPRNVVLTSPVWKPNTIVILIFLYINTEKERGKGKATTIRKGSEVWKEVYVYQNNIVHYIYLWTNSPNKKGAGGKIIFCKHCNVCRIKRNPVCSREPNRLPPWCTKNPNSVIALPAWTKSNRKLFIAIHEMLMT